MSWTSSTPFWTRPRAAANRKGERRYDGSPRFIHRSHPCARRPAVAAAREDRPAAAVCAVAAGCAAAFAAGPAGQQPGQRDERRGGRACRRAAADRPGRPPRPAARGRSGRCAARGCGRAAGTDEGKTSDPDDFENCLAHRGGDIGGRDAGAESGLPPEAAAGAAAACLRGKPHPGLARAGAAVAVPCGAVPAGDLSHARGGRRSGDARLCPAA